MNAPTTVSVELIGQNGKVVWRGSLRQFFKQRLPHWSRKSASDLIFQLRVDGAALLSSGKQVSLCR